MILFSNGWLVGGQHATLLKRFLAVILHQQNDKYAQFFIHSITLSCTIRLLECRFFSLVIIAVVAVVAVLAFSVAWFLWKHNWFVFSSGNLWRLYNFYWLRNYQGKSEPRLVISLILVIELRFDGCDRFHKMIFTISLMTYASGMVKFLELTVASWRGRHFFFISYENFASSHTQHRVGVTTSNLCIIL